MQKFSDTHLATSEQHGTKESEPRVKRDQEDIDQVLSFLKPRMPFQVERQGLVNIVSGVEAAEGRF